MLHIVGLRGTLYKIVFPHKNSFHSNTFFVQCFCSADYWIKTAIKVTAPFHVFTNAILQSFFTNSETSAHGFNEPGVKLNWALADSQTLQR